MFANIVVLLIFVGLAILFGWLFLRALKSKKLWVKIAGGVGAGLMTLLMIAIIVVGGRGIGILYFPGADAAPDITVEGSPEQIARGEYLVNISCVGCHGQLNADGIPDGHPLSGGWNIAEAEGFGFIGSLVTENLTPGGPLAAYSDGELFRALRQSINAKGYRLGMMGFLPYNQLSDSDTEAIIAYLRSVSPVETSVQGGDKANFIAMLMFGAGMMPVPEFTQGSVTAPPEGLSPEYGEYVATYGDCRSCHGPDMTGAPASALGPAVPNPRPFVSTITLDEFIQTMRTGVRPNGKALEMPWENASRMNDVDITALYNYMTAPLP